MSHEASHMFQAALHLPLSKIYDDEETCTGGAASFSSIASHSISTKPRPIIPATIVVFAGMTWRNLRPCALATALTKSSDCMYTLVCTTSTNPTLPNAWRTPSILSTIKSSCAVKKKKKKEKGKKKKKFVLKKKKKKKDRDK